MEDGVELELGNENALEIPIDENEMAPIEVLLPVEVKDELTSSSDDEDFQPLLEQPTILEGKRSRKPTSRLEFSVLTPSKKPIVVPQGQGKALGEIEHINQRLKHAATDTLSQMNQICFGRRGMKSMVKKNLRQFQGFDFDCHTEAYRKHLKSLTKLKKDQLQSISKLLGLPVGGRNEELAERILHFLVKPTDQEENGRPNRKSASIRTMKKRNTVPKRTRKSKPTSDETVLMDCQVKLDDFAQQSDSSLLMKLSPVKPTAEDPVNHSHNQTDQSDTNLVIDESHRTDDLNGPNAETSF